MEGISLGNIAPILLKLLFEKLVLIFPQQPGKKKSFDKVLFEI